jgi:hypothetical protein
LEENEVFYPVRKQPERKAKNTKGKENFLSLHTVTGQHLFTPNDDV